MSKDAESTVISGLNEYVLSKSLIYLHGGNNEITEENYRVENI